MPRNIPELILQYLNELNRNVIDDRISDRNIHSYAKAVAWLSIRQNLTSSYVSLTDAFSLINQTESKKIIGYLNDKLRIIKTIKPAKDKIRFVLDPIAEYLAGMHIVETFQESEWRNLIDRLQSVDETQKTSGFLSALIDCYYENLTNTDLSEYTLTSLKEIRDRS